MVILKYMTVAPVCSLNLPRLDMILFLDLLSFRIFDNYSIKWDWIWCEQLCIEENVNHRGWGGGGRGFCPGLWDVKWGESGHKRNVASYPDVSLSLSMKMCAQRTEGRRQRARRRFAYRLYPPHGPLWFITSHSRFALASTMRNTKRLRRRLNAMGKKRVRGFQKLLGKTA